MRSVLVGLLFTAVLSGCANVSRFEKGSLTAHGELLDDAQEPLYYLIHVDLQKSVDTRITSAVLKLSPESPPIAIEQLRPEWVARYLPPFMPPTQWPESWKKRAEEEDGYGGNGFHIRFANGELLSVGICSHCAGGREHPVVGTPDGEYYYTVPLTKQQLVDVFGPPERIHKVNEVRY